jgi:hypothetical protein
MIPPLLKSTVRHSIGGARMLTRYGLWATRTVASMVLKPPRQERQPHAAADPPSKPAEAKPATNARPTAEPAANATPTAELAHEGIPGRDAPPPRDREPHHALNNPVGEPDPTEWPDPYDTRPDPLDPLGAGPDADELPAGNPPHVPTGATSTSAPHPSQDPEAEPWEGPKHDKLDR